ncbi:hypothetical protein JB92DRAFT_873575 [Gautieria morchelliformis]|nr:hypothetical protein JB92DRAFT_873575 [Gautieria morchelliformis]
MPTFRGWTSHITVGRLQTPLPEEQVRVDNHVITCDIPCHPEERFRISLFNPDSDRRYICVFLLDGIQHDEYLASPGRVNDISIGWHEDARRTYPYQWVTPEKLHVRANGTYYADPSKVGVVTIRLYPALEGHHVKSNVFLRSPIISRGDLVRRLSYYARLADPRSMHHPTRTVIGCVSNFEWLDVNDEPFLEFNFQYYKRKRLLFYSSIFFKCFCDPEVEVPKPIKYGRQYGTKRVIKDISLVSERDTPSSDLSVSSRSPRSDFLIFCPFKYYS